MDDDIDIDQLLIRQMRRRRAKPRKARRKVQRKHVYRAYWLTQSFTHVSINNMARDEVFFVGSHKPGIIKNTEYPPTPVFGVVGSDFREAIPMEHDDFPKLVAALIRASNDTEINRKTRTNIEIIAKHPRRLYTEFDFNTVPYADLLNDCEDRHHIIPRVYYEHIAWMKRAFSQNVRVVKKRDLRVRQLIMVGRDVHNYIPVIALVKPRYNFYHIIPLPDGGINLLTALKTLIYRRPHIDYAIASVDNFERDIRTELNVKEERYSYFELNIPLKKIIDSLSE